MNARALDLVEELAPVERSASAVAIGSVATGAKYTSGSSSNSVRRAP